MRIRRVGIGSALIAAALFAWAGGAVANETDAGALAVSVQAGIKHQVARLGEPFSFTIPEDAFSGDSLSYQVEVFRRDLSGEVPDVLNDFWWQRDLSHHWLSYADGVLSGTPQSYEDLQTLQLLVTATDGDGAQAQAVFLLVVVDGTGEMAAPASVEAECAHVLGEGARGIVDGADLGIQPGDSICLRGGETTDGLTFRNLEGTATRPIYIINVGGHAISDAQGLSYSIQVNQSNHFKLLGAGSPDEPYGWTIQGDTGPGIQIKFCYQDIEVAWIEVQHSSFAGLSMKNDGEQRPEGDMFDVRAHDLYIHNTGTKADTQPPWAGEALYCGIGSWQEGTHSIHRLRVHHIIGHDIAWDALQIKNNDDGDAIIERNFIRRYGVGNAGNTGAHDEGLFAGEGSSGVFRYNWIEDAMGPSANGIQFFGAGNTLFHHNVIVNLAPGTVGRFPVYGARYGTLANPEDLSVRFIHNTFAGFQGMDSTKALVRVFTDFGTQETANNLFVDVDGSSITGTDAGGNVQMADYSGFADVGQRNLMPAAGSPVLVAGLARPEVVRDIRGTLIPAAGITTGAFQMPVVIFRDRFSAD